MLDTAVDCHLALRSIHGWKDFQQGQEIFLRLWIVHIHEGVDAGQGIHAEKFHGILGVAVRGVRLGTASSVQVDERDGRGDGKAQQRWRRKWRGWSGGTGRHVVDVVLVLL